MDSLSRQAGLRRPLRPCARGAGWGSVITTDRGLLAADTTVGTRELREFGTVDIRADHPEYLTPLRRDLGRLEEHDDLEVVLLGSVATGKYVDVLLEMLGERLLFPVEFVGRGDMSRGGFCCGRRKRGRS